MSQRKQSFSRQLIWSIFTGTVASGKWMCISNLIVALSCSFLRSNYGSNFADATSSTKLNVVFFYSTLLVSVNKCSLWSIARQLIVVNDESYPKEISPIPFHHIYPSISPAIALHRGDEGCNISNNGLMVISRAILNGGPTIVIREMCGFLHIWVEGSTKLWSTWRP